jgi:hypothetical protein
MSVNKHVKKSAYNPNIFLFHPTDVPGCLRGMKFHNTFSFRVQDDGAERGKSKIFRLMFTINKHPVTLHVKVLSKKAISNPCGPYARQTPSYKHSYKQRFHQSCMAWMVTPKTAVIMSNGPVLVCDQPPIERKFTSRYPPCVMSSNYDYTFSLMSSVDYPQIDKDSLRCEYTVASMQILIKAKNETRPLHIPMKLFSANITNMPSYRTTKNKNTLVELSPVDLSPTEPFEWVYQDNDSDDQEEEQAVKQEPLLKVRVEQVQKVEQVETNEEKQIGYVPPPPLLFSPLHWEEAVTKCFNVTDDQVTTTTSCQYQDFYA